jgi:hypothetical protein
VIREILLEPRAVHVLVETCIPSDRVDGDDSHLMMDSPDGHTATDLQSSPLQEAALTTIVSG